ncbi:putative aldo keto reductase [Rosellinia necatrix]|uniref:Putative aldo keto reductase n=1 Tax=Rosellinia necatrix TaxID=77044 RepID=A0A1W2TBC4_ROSNE|nr:putative aldo keto reductase [Rosellinia necatrix]
MVQIMGKEVGPTGYGLMGFTWRANPCSQEQAFEAMREAIQQGKVFWNGGEFYGTPEYNSMTLLDRYFAQYPEDADKIILSIKGGMDPVTHRPDGSPEGTRRTIDNCLRQLNGRKKLDMFEFARRDQNVDMGVSFDVIQKEYIDTGKVGGISLSEVRAETIHEAAKVAKIVACEVELSLFATDVLYNGVAEACAQYNIPLVAYSPIGRGFLTGEIKSFDDIPDGSFLKAIPRFQKGENFDNNIKLVHQVEALAKKKGCSPAQLAIGWVRALNGRPGMPTIIPIPGATTAERVKENAKVVELTDEDLAAIDQILDTFKPLGGRYPDFVPMET